jgi:peroxiredoxin
LSEFRDNADRIRQLGAGVIGLCVESDRAHKAFGDFLGLEFPLLSDFNRQVVGRFGIEYTPDAPFSGMYGMSRRSVFVVAPDSTIRYKWVTEDPLVPPHLEQVIAALEEIRHQPAE